MAFDLPPQAGPARDKAILDHVAAGDFSVTWGEVRSEYAGHSAVFRIFADGLKIGGIRINVTAANLQQVADVLDCMMLTARLHDLMWLQRKYTIPPLPRPITSSTEAMIDQSKKVDAEIRKAGADPDHLDGIVMSEGKTFILDNDIASNGRAMNAGWYFVGQSFGGSRWEGSVTPDPALGGQPMRLIQGRGTAHGPTHVDYSQICLLVSRRCEVDGQPADLAAVLSNKDLAGLAYHVPGVALRVLRQPGVPELVAQATPPCAGNGCPEVVRWSPEDKPEGHDAVPATNWGYVALAGLGIAVAVGGFLAGVRMMGGARRS